VVAALFPGPIVGVFMATGTEKAAQTIEYGGSYLRIRSVEFAFMALLQVLLGAYRGAGNTKTAMAFSMVALWLGRVPIVYGLAFVRDMGPTGVWIGMAFGNVIGAIAAALWFTRGTWKETVIDEEDADEGGEAEPAAPTPGSPDVSEATTPDASDAGGSSERE